MNQMRRLPLVVLKWGTNVAEALMMMTVRQFFPRRLLYAAMICHVSCKKARKSARGARKFIAMVHRH